jgi:hypothetical protein
MQDSEVSESNLTYYAIVNQDWANYRHYEISTNWGICEVYMDNNMVVILCYFNFISLYIKKEIKS